MRLAVSDNLTAIANFLDWLCDKGYVIAKRDNEHLWTPISERDGARLAAEFLEVNSNG